VIYNPSAAPESVSGLKHAVIFSADIFACQEIAMSCRLVRQTAKMQDLCFVTAYGSDLILT